MELLANLIRVTIVIDSKGTKCEGACGLDWTSTDNLTSVQKSVAGRFGNTVEIELLDLFSGDRRAPSLRERISEGNFNLPLLLVNDEVRIAGEFDARQLIDTIEVEVEIHGT